MRLWCAPGEWYTPHGTMHHIPDQRHCTQGAGHFFDDVFLEFLERNLVEFSPARSMLLSRRQSLVRHMRHPGSVDNGRLVGTVRVLVASMLTGKSGPNEYMYFDRAISHCLN